MDLDLRKLRYFAAVAQERHFGRAAAGLHIAQPVLSRQVRALERELGCELLVRTTRSVELTPAGEQLLTESRGVLAGADAAVRRVLERDRGRERLVVAFAPGLRVSEAVLAYRRTHPAVDVELTPLSWWEQDAPLRDGRADVGLLRRPFDATGLYVEPVGAEDVLACLPASHRLATRERLRRADLDGEIVFNDLPARRTSSLEEKFERIALGEGVALVPRAVGESHPRPDLVLRPVVDEPRRETCVAVAEDRRESRVLDFVRLAIDVLADRRPPLAAVE